MKAAVVRQFGQPLVIEDRPVPEPGPGRSPCEWWLPGCATRVSYETRPLSGVNEAIAEVRHGRAKARLVLYP